MPNISCLSPSFKKELLELAKDAGIEAADLKKLKGVPDCEGDEDIGFVRGKRAGGAKRAPSPYNLFIRECFKANPGTTLKDCAVAYKKKKGA